MSLNRVVGKKVLEEDLVVYGVVKLTDEGDKTPYMDMPIVANDKGFVEADTNGFINAPMCSVESGDNKYRRGFHRFLNIKDAEKRKGNDSMQTIRKYIIPKGTEVVIGKEKEEGYVVVSPVLSLATTHKSNKGERNEIIQSNGECTTTRNHSVVGK